MILPRIGELKDLIDIVNVTAPYDLTGAGTVVSTFARNVRAKISPLGGSLNEETQQIQVFSQTYNIWIRYLTGVTAFQQIEWSGTRLVMTGPPEDFGRWLLIHAEERTSRKL
jgi:SPP1 family predicted phage head-tail adaptor